MIRRTVISAVSIAAIGIATLAHAGAPEWTLVANAKDSTAFVDRLSVNSQAGKASIWVLRNYTQTVDLGLDPATGEALYPHRSVKVQYRVNCDTGRVALDSWQMFSGNFANGEVVWADTEHGVRADAAPATTEEKAALGAACGTKTAAR